MNNIKIHKPLSNKPCGNSINLYPFMRKNYWMKRRMYSNKNMDLMNHSVSLIKQMINNTSLYENYESSIFKNINFCVKYQIIGQRIYQEQMYTTRLLNFVDNYYWQY